MQINSFKYLLIKKTVNQKFNCCFYQGNTFDCFLNRDPDPTSL